MKLNKMNAKRIKTDKTIFYKKLNFILNLFKLLVKTKKDIKNLK